MSATFTKGKTTAPKNTANVNYGFNIIEIIITISILTIITLTATSTYSDNNYKSQQQYVLSEINNLIIFAKHYALTNKAQVTICPTKNLLHCSNDWGTGYIAYTKDGAIKKASKFPTNFKPFSLTLHAFGKTLNINTSNLNNNKIVISKFGTTHNNGHFLYMNKSGNGTNYICWNKQLRVYRSSNGCG